MSCLAFGGQTCGHRVPQMHVLMLGETPIAKVELCEPHLAEAQSIVESLRRLLDLRRDE